MLKDRGNIKWTSLMLPEHVEQLKKLWVDQRKEARPTLDEQELEEMNQICVDAFINKYQIEVTVYEGGEREHFSGTITKIDQANHLIHLQNSFDIKKFPFTKIIHIKTTSN